MYASRKKSKSFYILDYLLELMIKIWQLGIYFSNSDKFGPKKDATTAHKVPALLLDESQLCIILGVCYSSKDLKEGGIES
jgi:hypothetical protein